MSGAELNARITSARALLADFQRESADSHDVGWRDWQVWALRLAQHLQFVVEVTSPGTAAGSWVGPDGTAALTAEDVGLVVAALRAAVDIAGSDDRYEIAALLFRPGDVP